MRKDVSHDRFLEFLSQPNYSVPFFHWRGHGGKMSSAFIAYFSPLWITQNRFIRSRRMSNKFSSQPAISTLFAAVDIYYSLTGDGHYRHLPILAPGVIIVRYVCTN